MKNARFNTPLVVVNDRFICALGGQHNKQGDLCECFDTIRNQWFDL